MQASDEIVEQLRAWLEPASPQPSPGVGFFPAADMPHHRAHLQDLDELRLYLAVLERLPVRDLCLEVGLYRGATHFAWKQLFGEVISIDNDYWACCKAAVEFHDPASKFVYGDSRSPATTATCATLIGSRRADHLFIDGSHDYASVISDFVTYASFVRAGGIVGFHDFHFIESEVARVVADLEGGRIAGWPPVEVEVIGNRFGIAYFHVPATSGARVAW